MGDTRFRPYYERVRDAPSAADAIRSLSDEGVISALAAASREHNPYLANVLASEALNRARQKEAITTALGEGVYVVDEGGVLTFINPAAERMLALDARTALGRPIHDVVHPPGRNLAAEPCPLLRTLASAETIQADDVRFACEGGDSFPVALTAAPIVRDGAVEGAVVAFQDITERKAAEEGLRRSERCLAAAQQIAHVGSWEWEPGSDRAVWSEEMYRIFGLPPGSPPLTWESYLAKVAAEERSDIAGSLEGILRDGQPLDFEQTIVRPDGAVRLVHGRVEVVPDAPGQPVRLVGTMQDITERKRAEEGRVQALRELETLMETIPDLISQLDTQGRLVRWNRRVEEVTGLASAQLRLRPAVELVRPEDRAQVQEGIERVLRDGFAVVEAELLAEGVGTIPHQWACRLATDAEGKPVGITAAGRDITERRRWERELLRSDERFRLLARATRDTAYDWDLVTNEMWLSENFWEMSGYERGAVVPDIRFWIAQIHPDDEPATTASLFEALQGTADSWSAEYRFRRADGTYARLFERAHIMREDGRPTRMVGSVMDLDARDTR